MGLLKVELARTSLQQVKPSMNNFTNEGYVNFGVYYSIPTLKLQI